MRSVQFIFMIIVPMINVSSLEKYLVTTLFHRYIEAKDKNQNIDALKKMSYNERKLAQIKLSLKERKRIKPQKYPHIIETLRENLFEYFQSLKFNDEDYYFRKGRLRISKSMRTYRNTIKFLTP